MPGLGIQGLTGIKWIAESPILTVDAIVEYENKILVIKRKYPPLGLALPGGRVEVGESTEDAVKRELKEETNLLASRVKLFKVYSNPERDPRFHAVSIVYIVECFGFIVEAGDDAVDHEWIPYNDVYNTKFAFDHKNIIIDYLNLIERKQ